MSNAAFPIEPNSAGASNTGNGAEWRPQPGRMPFFFVLFIAVAGLAYSGVLHFESWGQVDDLWAFRFSPEAVKDHPHFYRYLTVYPGYLLSDLWGERMFSLYITLFMMAGVMLIASHLRDVNVFGLAIVILAYVAPHFIMNGRGAISWAAWVLAIFTILQADRRGWRAKDGILVGLALLGGTVSTGVFAVVYGVFSVSFVRLFWGTNRIRAFVALVPGLVFFFNFFLISVEKNILFFAEYGGGAVAELINHGIGRFVVGSHVYLLLATLVAMLTPFAAHFILRKFGVTGGILLIAPLLGGMFGVTTATLLLPSLAIVVLARLPTFQMRGSGSTNPALNVKRERGG